MSAKLKFLLIAVFSIFATAATGVYITQRQPSAAVSSISNEQPQQLSAVNSTEDLAAYPERFSYQTIPLEEINSPLQGSDPAELALNAFGKELQSHAGLRKVEVYYPQPNQALVTITQTRHTNASSKAMKYRVELTTFGRSLLVSSPRVWQIVWAGAQKECTPGSHLQKNEC